MVSVLLNVPLPSAGVRSRRMLLKVFWPQVFKGSGNASRLEL